MTPEQKRERFKELIEVIDDHGNTLEAINKILPVALLETIQEYLAEEFEFVYDNDHWIWKEDKTYKQTQWELAKGDEELYRQKDEE